VLRLDGSDTSPKSGGFNLTGLSLQCASFKDGALELNNGETVTLTRARLEWVDATLDTSRSTLTTFGCPAYLNADRKDLLFSVDLAVKPSIDVTDYVQRGVCLLAHN
jgi:dynein heavy chain 1, cytosolic